jgi:hypothetical protein
MELIKRTILLEDSIDRRYDSPTYGQLTATSFYVNVILTQNVDDMGMFTDVVYLPDFVGQNTPVNYGPLVDKLENNNTIFPFMTGGTPQPITSLDPDVRMVGKTASNYYVSGGIVTANTESRLQDVKSYNDNDQYRLNFDVENQVYVNFSGETLDGVSRVTNIDEPMGYVFDADKNDPNIGKPTQKDGLLFKDFTGTGITTITYRSQGWNQTNTTISGITKEEYLFGIISKPEVKNDVFIDRGITTVFEKHLKLSEVRTLEELQRYGRGYFNLTKQ